MRVVHFVLFLPFFFYSFSAIGQASQMIDESIRRSDNECIYVLSHNDQNIGTVITLNNSIQEVKVKYFTSGDPYSAFYAWKKNKNIVALFSGGYSDRDRVVGFSAEDGRILSKTVESKMDALVTIDSLGILDVFNVTDCFQMNKKAASRKYCLLSSAVDRKDYCQELELRQLTIFQSHLLIWNNKLAMDANANQESAERRILILGQKNNERVTFLVNVDKSMTLYEVSTLLLETFIAFDVLAMVNLDVGTYDIFRLYDINGNELSAYSKGNPLKANNLMVLYY